MTHTTDVLFFLALCIQAGSLLLLWTSPEACRLVAVYLLARADSIEAGRRRMQDAKNHYSSLLETRSREETDSSVSIRTEARACSWAD